MYNSAPNDSLPSIHGFKVESLDGGVLDLAQFKGKKILIVNTASECGYTPQYKALQQLYAENKAHLVIVGFPCNDFGGQEPGSSEVIQSFCQKNYGVSFPMAAKVSITNNPAPIYKWLTNKKENGVLDANVRWNFNKFLLDENGRMLGYFPSSVAPDDAELKELLKK
jgi:glutathione peroxidase